MKIIIKQGQKFFKSSQKLQQSQLHNFISSHRFFHSSMSVQQLASMIYSSAKKNNQVGSRSQSAEKQYQKQQSCEQLSLYLNRANNQQIFKLFSLIVQHPKGITYQSLSKSLKTDIITISHYCCKLKKLKLIDWEHEKEGVKVFPKEKSSQQEEKEIKYLPSKNEVFFDYRESFMFRELGMVENIWINVSGEEAVVKGGITNEEIKRKIMKHAENKMVRRTVESMKEFARNAERQGKVFQFKYKNQTQQIKVQISRKNQIQVTQQIQQLDEAILEWLQNKFPQFQQQNFLLKLINNKFKDYISSLGVKQSKRQCTPLKLNRYIKVLNYLHKEGGMRENELRGLIVRDQTKFNIGIMHKRSLLGILDGLKKLEIVTEDENGCYYPAWIQEEKRFRKQETVIKRPKEDVEEAPTRKRIHLSKSDKNKSQPKDNKKETNHKLQCKFKKITQKQYKYQLLSDLTRLQLQKAFRRIYRKAFNRIVYVERKKFQQKYTSQPNILHLLQQTTPFQLQFNASQTIEDFYRSLDISIEEKRQIQDTNLEIDNEIIKFVRKNPIKSINSLRIKYGKNWRMKFQPLLQSGILQISESSIHLNSPSFLI